MEQIQQYAKTYQEYKQELDTELSRTAEGFVRIGYLLKVARDTDVLEQSPYQTVTEFARAEYGIDKTMVSRFISINDRFSEGGYSDQLMEQYRGYGYSKLTLMLTLPDEINQELSPSYSKKEIQEIKDEVEAERAISDLEVMMEDPVEQAGGQAREENLLDLLIHQLGEDVPEMYIQMAKIGAMEEQEWTRRAKEILAPDAEKQYSIRISGKGRYMMSIRETEDTVTTTSLRTMEKASYTYQDLMRAWEEILPPTGTPDTDWTEKDIQNGWENIYNREFPQKAKVAPVQHPAKPGKTESKPAPRKESKVQKAPTKPVQKEPPQKPAPPASEPETEKTAPEEPESADQELLLHPGMRVRNAGGVIGHPIADGTVKGQGYIPGTWTVKYDGFSTTRLIVSSEVKYLEIIDNEQLPGQIELEEAIAEADMRAAGSGPEESVPAAGQEPAEELDAEWEKKKEALDTSVTAMTGEGTIMSGKLSCLPPRGLREVRKQLIDMAALIERELLRRGEEF